MRLVIVGSRSITDPVVVFPIISRFIKEHVVGTPVILSGGANGVDGLAREYAKAHGIDFVEFLPYHLLDKGAEFNARFFFTRNRQMINNADRVLALWDEESTGTLHAIRYSQKVGVPIMIVKLPKSK